MWNNYAYKVNFFVVLVALGIAELHYKMNFFLLVALGIAELQLFINISVLIFAL